MTQHLSPQQRYRQDLSCPGFIQDPAQAEAVTHLQALYEALLAKPTRPWWRFWQAATPAPVKGLYFWGGVGRGKTYLMDNFYESLPFERKMRVHFHRFMRRVHADLKRLTGTVNPLTQVAAGIADEARVICFDEFFVSDIGDAMILAGLLRELFARGVPPPPTPPPPPPPPHPPPPPPPRPLPPPPPPHPHTHPLNPPRGPHHRPPPLPHPP